MLRVSLSRSSITASIASLATLNAIMLLGTYLAKTVFPEGGAVVQLTIGELNLTGENKIGAWFSSMMLLAVALAALACWSLDRRGAERFWDRGLTLGWAVIAFLFAGLSLDEMGSLHERIPELLRIELSDSLNGWVEALAIPIAAVALFFLIFAATRLQRSPASAALMMLGALLFVSVPVQEQIEVTARWSSALPNEYRRPVAFALLEEGTELFAMLCFLAAFLLYARARVLTRTEHDEAEAAHFRPNPAGTALGIVATSAAVLLLVYAVLPRIPDRPGLGVPLNWLPSALAFLSFSLAVGRWRDARVRADGAGDAVPLLILGLLSLGFSADHGAGQRFTTHMASNHAAIRLALDASLAAAVLIAASGVARVTRGRWPATGLAGWACLQVLAIFSPGAGNPLLSAAAFALLLPALLAALDDGLATRSAEPRPLRHAARAG